MMFLGKLASYDIPAYSFKEDDELLSEVLFNKMFQSGKGFLLILRP